MQNQKLSPVVRRAAAVGRAMVLVLSALASLSAGSALAATTYRVEFLEGMDPAFPYSSAYAIGPTGLVVGRSTNNGEDWVPVLWNEAGQLTNLAIGLPIGSGAVSDNSFAADVNGTGQVLVNAGPGLNFPYLWSNGTLTPVYLGGLNGTLTAINEAGQIAGVLTTSGGYRAFVQSGSVTTNLGTLPGGNSSVASDVNNKTQVVGTAYSPVTSSNHAVLWNNGTIIDLGTLPGDTSSMAVAINDAGQVAGTSTSVGRPSRVFRWENGVMTDLGGLGSGFAFATDMNNSGQIVGYTELSNFRRGAFLMSNGATTNLNLVLGDNSCNAYGINDATQIVGECGGRVYRLTPTAPGTDVGVLINPVTSTATQGSPLTYDITVANVGSLPATGVTLTDVLPAGANFVSIVPSQGSCSDGASIVCALGELASGASASVQMTVTPTVTGALTNSVSITSHETDVNNVNNAASTTVTVNAPIVPADLSVTMTDSPDPARRRTNVTYSITVKNAGPGSASGVTVTDLLGGMNFVSITSSQGTCSGPGYFNPALICSLGTMASGASASVTIVARPQLAGTYTNTVTVRSGTADNNNANNSASATTTVR